MLDQGFIKLYRTMLDWGWYTDLNTKTLFIHLLLTVNYFDDQWRGVTVKRGQRVCSYGILSKETGLSVRSIRTAINHLKSTGEVTYEANSKYGLITVTTYDENQQATDTVPVSRQTTDSQATVKRQQIKKARKQESKNTKKQDKIEYAEYVTMKQSEYDKLVAELGEQGAKQCIDILDNYKGANGKTYKDDYRAIRSWVIKRLQQESSTDAAPLVFVAPKPEDDAPYRKSIPDNATLADILPPVEEVSPW